VKSVEIKGGHPVLAKSAENAVFKRKGESAARETRELVEIKFNPESLVLCTPQSISSEVDGFAGDVLINTVKAPPSYSIVSAISHCLC
jgi:hypothetical protein